MAHPGRADLPLSFGRPIRSRLRVDQEQPLFAPFVLEFHRPAIFGDQTAGRRNFNRAVAIHREPPDQHRRQ